MSTVKVINVVHPSSSTNNIVLDSSGNASFGGTMAMSSSFMRNRIINGAMVIDQRNAGAAVTTTGAYTVDRFANTQSGGGVISWARSTTAPTGFTNSLSGTVTTPDSSIAAGDIYRLYQYIEGFNCADLAFGTASASTVTVSFWVRSSITGTYCLGLQNGTYNRGYAANYTINAANTWEYKTVTIAGDTTGTWATDNTAGIAVFWDFGSGTTWNQTANTWAASNTWKTSSQTNWISTNGATFYLTGVQLEVGSVATPFEREIYSNTLAKCQRYYTRFVTGSGSNGGFLVGVVTSSTQAGRCTATLPVTMRANPTFNSSTIRIYDSSGVPSATGVDGNYSSTTTACVDLRASGGGLTTGRAAIIIEGASTAYIDFSAEL